MAENQTDLCALAINDKMEIITIIICVIGLIIISFITYHSVKELPKCTKLHRTIKNLYYVCIITTYLALFLTLIPGILCIIPTSPFYWEIIIMDTILNLVAYISLLALLAILIFRLYYTFRTSAYKLSRAVDCLFIILYSITCIFVLLNMIEVACVSFIYGGNWNIADDALNFQLGYIGMVAICMYMITACYAIGLFVKKLMDLVISTQESKKDLTVRQVSLIDSASKYVSVLSLAIIFSMLTAITLMLATFLWDTAIDNNYAEGNNLLAQCMTLITTICCVINNICLYLQFPFSTSTKYYNKYCKGCLECYWNDRLTRHARKSISFKPVRNETDKYEESDGDVTLTTYK